MTAAFALDHSGREVLVLVMHNLIFSLLIEPPLPWFVGKDDSHISHRTAMHVRKRTVPLACRQNAVQRQSACGNFHRCRKCNKARTPHDVN